MAQFEEYASTNNSLCLFPVEMILKSRYFILSAAGNLNSHSRVLIIVGLELQTKKMYFHAVGSFGLR